MVVGSQPEPASSSISDDVSTAAPFEPPPTSSPQKLDITYTHHHILSFNTATSSSDTTLVDQIKSLKLSIRNNHPGELDASSHIPTNTTSSSAALRIRAITIDGFSIQYSTESLPEPPTLGYKVHELERLFHDWYHGDKLVVQGVGIPICHWQKMYSRTRPLAWKKIKDQWTKYRFIVGALRFHNGVMKDFWEYLAAQTPTELADQKFTMKGITDILRQIRTDRNKLDVEQAKQEYDSDEYSRTFSYRKGGRKCIMKREQDIARCYRKAKQVKVYWDEDVEEDLGSEEEGDL